MPFPVPSERPPGAFYCWTSSPVKSQAVSAYAMFCDGWRSDQIALRMCIKESVAVELIALGRQYQRVSSVANGTYNATNDRGSEHENNRGDGEPHHKYSDRATDVE